MFWKFESYIIDSVVKNKNKSNFDVTALKESDGEQKSGGSWNNERVLGRNKSAESAELWPVVGQDEK